MDDTHRSYAWCRPFAVGSQTLADLAVGVDTPAGYRLVSWLDVMTDDLFAGYAARGIVSRSSAAITRAARDADPLRCDGETFTNTGSLAVWMPLH